MMAEKEKVNNFEKDIKELENIVHALESGETSLDEMLKQFEKGIELSRSCTKVLDEAEKKITILTKPKVGAVSEQASPVRQNANPDGEVEE